MSMGRLVSHKYAQFSKQCIIAIPMMEMPVTDVIILVKLLVDNVNNNHVQSVSTEIMVRYVMVYQNVIFLP